MTEDTGDFDPRDPEEGKEATFLLFSERYEAAVEHPETWTEEDWANLVLAVVREAKRYTGKLPRVDEGVLAALCLRSEES